MGGVGSPWEAGSLRGGLERGGLERGAGGAAVTGGLERGGGGAAVTGGLERGGGGAAVTGGLERGGGGAAVTGGLERGGGGAAVTGGLERGGGGAAVTESVFLGGTTGGGAEEAVVGTVVSRAGMWGNVSSVVSLRVGTGGGVCSSGVMDFLEMDRGKGFGRVGTLGDEDGGVVLSLIPIFFSSVLALSRMLFGVRGGESSFSFTSSSPLGSAGGFGATRTGSGFGFLVGVGGRWFGLSRPPFGSAGLGLGGILGLGGSFSELSRDSFDRLACLSLCLSQAGFSTVCDSWTGGLG